MNYHEMVGDVEKGDVITVHRRERSLDNGATWTTMTSAHRVMCVGDIDDHTETGRKFGPSMSGFWGNSNEIRSGSVEVSFRKWTGSRWVSISAGRATDIIQGGAG